MNPIKDILVKKGITPSHMLKKLEGVISPKTFYNVISPQGIPDKSQWGSIKKLVNALGYKIVFVEDKENE